MIDTLQRIRYGKQGQASNIVVPVLRLNRTDDGAGRLVGPFFAQQVILAHQDDCERVCRCHVKKQPNFVGTLMSSVISTTDNENWKMQRGELNEAFLAEASLSKLLPISLARSRKCVEKLAHEAAISSNHEVDMNEFFLYETQAQLQLAMFGNSEHFMEQTNSGIRGVFAATADPRYGRQWGLQVLDGSAAGPDRTPVAPSNIIPPSCPMHRSHRPATVAAAVKNKCPFAPADSHQVTGPLTRILMESESNFPSRWGNTMLFAFAGHDTTGHTLTWLTFELAKHPQIQDKLIDEVDNFWATKQQDNTKQPIKYDDLKRLPFMTRCIMETLRRWPAVGNGSFREIQFDEYILVRASSGVCDCSSFSIFTMCLKCIVRLVLASLSFFLCIYFFLMQYCW